MASTIKHKRSTTAGAVPAAGALVEGELAVNVADGKVFVKRSNGTVSNVTADGHSHAIGDVSGLQTALDGKAASSHTHAASAINSGTLDIARIPTGTTSSTVCIGNDSRLSDARTPTAHSHAASDVTSGTFNIARIPTGTTSSTVALGNHNHALSTLTGVSISSPSSGQVLKFNGTNWINDTDATGGGGSVTAEDDQIILAMRVFA